MNSTEILRRLVGFDTTSSKSNRACIDWMASWLQQHGARVAIQEVSATHANLWASFGAEAAGGVVLAGHSDVVPVADQIWSSDPFTLTERDGKFFGRGTCDMKGFIACALALAPRLQHMTLQRPVHMAFTYNEEVDMEGVRQMVPWLAGKARPEWVWLGEPTMMEVVSAHKGTNKFSTTIRGVAAHSSLPQLGVNAIALMGRVLRWLEETAAAKAAAPFVGSPFDPPYTTFNAGVIRGGTAANIVAEECSLSWAFRLHPGDDAAAIERSFADYIARTIQPELNRLPGTSIHTASQLSVKPFLPREGNRAEAALCHLTGQNHGKAVSYATEAGFFQDLGADVVVCGPGSIDQAHKADEFVAISQLERCDQMLGRWLDGLGRSAAA